ncbi:MAG: thylakoid membrane protein ThyD [Microcoleus sp.]
MKVAIAGATGFVGSRLVERLQAQGHYTVILARDAARAQRIFPASAYPNLEVVACKPAESGEWQKSIAGCDAAVNLAGAPIAEEKWTQARQQEILDSRKLTTQKLVEAIESANSRPSVLVSASAIGYYGTSETAEFDENSPAGNDFLTDVCTTWEAEATKVKNSGTRLAILRFGIVLGKGGALAKMLPAFKLFAGGPIGTGKQWFSWIHREDVVNLILYALENPQVQGVFNATAPNPVRMNELCETLGKVLQRPSWLPVPAFALELLLGDGAKVVLEGQKVLPKQTLASGFQYQYPDLRSALEEIVGSN